MAFKTSARVKQTDMNMSALKLADPQVLTILESASHVALYSFSSSSNQWDKLEVEGALFLCTRSTHPKYILLVLNRLSTTNLLEPINNLDVEVQEPFLLYRNGQGEIHALWFYHPEDCVKIASVINKITSPETNSNKFHSPFPVMGAQEPENTMDGTSKRVLDFFAKASNAPQPPGVFNLRNFQPEAEKKEVNHPILQRLMSNPQPVHTLEQIEKQQRVTPQESRSQKERPRSLHVASDALENGIGFMRISETSPARNLVSPIELEVSQLERNLGPKPALLPPVMFATSSSSATSAPAQEQPPLTSLNVRPEPLTKSQLLQAVSYLLKNDSDFVNKLHEAYVKSFVDMVS